MSAHFIIRVWYFEQTQTLSDHSESLSNTVFLFFIRVSFNCFQIDVVDETRQYAEWEKDVSITSGIIAGKRALNRIHSELGLQGYNQVILIMESTTFKILFFRIKTNTFCIIYFFSNLAVFLEENLPPKVYPWSYFGLQLLEGLLELINFGLRLLGLVAGLGLFFSSSS